MGVSENMRLPRSRKRAKIMLLPLMDVVFLILVFLIYAMLAMVARTGFPVALPLAQSGKPDQQIALALTIDRDGALWLDKKQVALVDLPEALLASDTRGEEQERAVQVFADAKLPYERLYAVLEELKKAGLRKISLQARREGS